VPRPKHERNAKKRAEANQRRACAGIWQGRQTADGGDAQPAPGAGSSHLHPEHTLQIATTSGSPRDAWIQWLRPHFDGNESAYFTGTYSDEYGIPNGLMKAHNVHKDVRNFLHSLALDDRRFIIGVESHRWRDVLHWHGIIEGAFSPIELQILKAAWASERGHGRALPVLDGCASYVTKYALKADTDNFDFELPS